MSRKLLPFIYHIARNTLNHKLIVTALIYLSINFLFVIKYAGRLDNVNEHITFLLYSIILSLFILTYIRLDLKNYYKPLFIITSIIFFLFTLYINYSIDGNALNVDRWSAMEVGIQALLKGDYPYSAVDHLGGRTSNLPSLIIIGIPFYLIGNIGLLQSFAFVLFIYSLNVTFENYKVRLLCLFLLILSPAYIWEIYVKSDLMSNFIFVLLFVVIVKKRTSINKNINYLALSFWSTVLLMTRITTLIPISLLLFKDFYNYAFRKKVLFIFIAIITILSFVFICFKNVGSIDNFFDYNPFELQNRPVPTVMSFILILIPALYSFRIENMRSFMIWSTIFLLLPITIAFLSSIFKNGMYLTIYKSYFDISYFNMVLPFLLFSLTFNITVLLQERDETIAIKV